MSWLLVAAGALLLAPLGLMALWAAGGLPPWLSPWAIYLLLLVSVAAFLAAAHRDLQSFSQ